MSGSQCHNAEYYNESLNKKPEEPKGEYLHEPGERKMFSKEGTSEYYRISRSAQGD